MLSVIAPGPAPSGTTTRIRVSVHSIVLGFGIGAAVPGNTTEPCVPKFRPVIVSSVPGQASAGASPVMRYAGIESRSFAASVVAMMRQRSLSDGGSIAGERNRATTSAIVGCTRPIPGPLGFPPGKPGAAQGSHPPDRPAALRLGVRHQEAAAEQAAEAGHAEGHGPGRPHHDVHRRHVPGCSHPGKRLEPVSARTGRRRGRPPCRPAHRACGRQ